MPSRKQGSLAPRSQIHPKLLSTSVGRASDAVRRRAAAPNRSEESRLAGDTSLADHRLSHLFVQPFLWPNKRRGRRAEKGGAVAPPQQVRPSGAGRRGAGREAPTFFQRRRITSMEKARGGNLHHLAGTRDNAKRRERRGILVDHSQSIPSPPP